MSSFIRKITKVARETLPDRARFKLNDLLYDVKGFDYIKEILNKFGFDIGEEFSKNKFKLIYKGEEFKNVYLSGNQNGMEVVTGNILEEKSNPRFNPDVLSSPGYAYERIERIKED